MPPLQPMLSSLLLPFASAVVLFVIVVVVFVIVVKIEIAFTALVASPDASLQ